MLAEIEGKEGDPTSAGLTHSRKPRPAFCEAWGRTFWRLWSPQLWSDGPLHQPCSSLRPNSQGTYIWTHLAAIPRPLQLRGSLSEKSIWDSPNLSPWSSPGLMPQPFGRPEQAIQGHSTEEVVIHCQCIHFQTQSAWGRGGGAEHIRFQQLHIGPRSFRLLAELSGGTHLTAAPMLETVWQHCLSDCKYELIW